MRMDIPFTLDFCHNVTFDIVCTMCCSLVVETNTFVNEYHILLVVCISVSNMGDPQTLISKQNSYFKIELLPLIHH